MVFYKGAVSYGDLNEMPLDEVLQLNHFASKINKAQEYESKKAMRKR
jgi:hypothetical protein